MKKEKTELNQSDWEKISSGLGINFGKNQTGEYLVIPPEDSHICFVYKEALEAAGFVVVEDGSQVSRSMRILTRSGQNALEGYSVGRESDSLCQVRDILTSFLPQLNY